MSNTPEPHRPPAESGTKIQSSGIKTGKSIIHSQNKQMMKSQVSVREIEDAEVKDLFENCVTKRVELVKTTQEHNTYVRKEDYFDMSRGVDVNPNRDADLENANYHTASGPDVLTPPVNRYFYEQDAWNILNQRPAINWQNLILQYPLSYISHY